MSVSGFLIVRLRSADHAEQCGKFENSGLESEGCKIFLISEMERCCSFGAALYVI